MSLHKNIAETISREGGVLYLVGSAVRDEVMGISDSKDFDFVVTGLPIEQLKTLLAQYGQVEGKSLGVLKLLVGGNEMNFTLPRTEFSTGKGCKDSAETFNHSLFIEKDLACRDFTMNAMAKNVLTSDIVDPFDGRSDIKKKLIRLAFMKAFEKDPQKLLQAIQFAVRFNMRLSRDILLRIRQNAYRIKLVAGEQIFEELKNIMLQSERPSEAFILMKDTDLLMGVLPELAAAVGMDQPMKFHKMDVFEHTMVVLDGVPTTKLHVRLAALFHDLGKVKTRKVINGEIHFFGHEVVGARLAGEVLNDRFHAPAALTEQVVSLVKNHMFPADWKLSSCTVRRLISRVGESLIRDLIVLRIGDRLGSGKAMLSMGKIGKLMDMVELELANPIFSLKNLAINGQDLIELGMSPGPEFSRILLALLEQVKENPELNNKELMLLKVKEMMCPL
jgi:putative nucleotidyltransferase with HDIG domain